VHVTEAAEQLWADAQRLEEGARQALHQVAELRCEAVHRVREDRYKLDAAAAAFGVTVSRIHQVGGAKDGRPAPEPTA
jgi:hypothetical protein